MNDGVTAVSGLIKFWHPNSRNNHSTDSGKKSPGVVVFEYFQAEFIFNCFQAIVF